MALGLFRRPRRRSRLLADTFWYLGSSEGGAATAPDGMVVFGFGRGPGTQPLLRGAGQRFTVGLLELGVASEKDHAAVAARIESLLADRTRKSTAAPGIEIWYGPVQRFGHRGEPQRWINVLGNVASASEVSSATYSINRGQPRPLTLGTDFHRLAARGDFNLELNWDELCPVTNTITVTAQYRHGASLSTNITLLVHRHRIWPLPYRVNFAATTNIQEVVQVVDGRWTLTEDGVRTAHPWYDRVLSLGDTTWTNYEARVRLTVHGFIPPQRGPPTYDVTHFGVALRWRGHTADGKQPSERWHPLGAQGELLLKNDPRQSRWRVLLDGGPGFAPHLRNGSRAGALESTARRAGTGQHPARRPLSLPLQTLARSRTGAGGLVGRGVRGRRPRLSFRLTLFGPAQLGCDPS